ncbi:MAG: CBS domain-containing protein [Synergistetes bacterium]|nr:MAG: CBS domain containing membrane protein [bacterium 42_11]MBC7331514.1 CBS domain-containing protein [Synergistota bacterium]MDK2870798.1 acetoin utilization protein AcuB [bacterium]
MLVKDVMTPNPITIKPETSFQDALKLIRDKGIRRLPVVNEEGKLVGIVTEKDLLYASPSKATTLDIWELSYLLSKLQVKDIMTKDVVTVSEDIPIEEAAKIMADRKVGGLPVMRDGGLVGIITETDIFKILLRLLGAGRDGRRFVFELPDKKGVLAQLTQLIARYGGNIIALATYPSPHEGKARVVVKVDELDEPKFLEALKGLEISICDFK